MSKVDKSIFQSETQKYFSAQDSKEFLRRRNDAALLKNSKPSTMSSSKTTRRKCDYFEYY